MYDDGGLSRPLVAGLIELHGERADTTTNLHDPPTSKTLDLASFILETTIAKRQPQEVGSQFDGAYESTETTSASRVVFALSDKKLKCDRSAPCQNCVKAQIAHSCKYQRNSNVSSKECLSDSSTPTNVVEDLQARLTKVEELLGIQVRNEAASTENPKQQTIGTVILKGNRSVFHGQNARTTLLNQFSDVKGFLNEISKDKRTQASAKQIKFLQNRSQSKIGSPDGASVSDFSVALLKLREFLPPKPYCDRLLDIYCRHFERTFRVLHIPTFLRRYDQIWTNDDDADLCASSSIVPELTAVMTMAYHMDDAKHLGDDRNHRLYLKGVAIDLIQAWLDELGRKQRTELSTLQVEVLLLLSKSLGGLQPEKLWSSTGALVRSAMVMGLNVDPASVKGMSPYHAEMRRRIWATILEMDLQASMFCGMPLVVPELNTKSFQPSNINDAEFEESTTTLPASCPTHTYTDNLFQVVLASSLPQRLKALSLIQHPVPNIQEGISVAANLRECLTQKPQILELHNSTGAPSDGGSLLHCILLDLYMRRPILSLYKALLLGESRNPLLSDVQKHCLECSQIILSYQDFFTVPALAPVTSKPSALQNFFYQCCKTDILWAALTCCQQIKQNLRSTSIDSTHGSDDLIHTVGTTITYLIDRMGQKGSDLKDIVFLTLALQSAQLQDDFPEKLQVLQEVVQKTLAACREKLLHPLVSSESSINTLQLSKGANKDAALLPVSMPDTAVPLDSSSRLTPTSSIDAAFSLGSATSVDHSFGNLFDLAAEYNTFEASMYSPDDLLNFGTAQSWNWEHMWQ